jgi:aminopeptidase N
MAKVTSSQTYQKGSWVLHMLRGVVGTENFWKGIRSYYKKYQDSNATTGDFQREMEEASGMDLSVFFEQWLYKGGTLKYVGNWQYSQQESQVRITLNQVQTDGSLFEMPIEIAIYYQGLDRPQIVVVQADKKSNVFTLQVGSEPKNIVIDPNTWVLMDADFRKNE